MQIIVYSTLSLYFIYKIYREFYPSQRKKWTILYIFILVKSYTYPIADYIWEYIKTKISYWQKFSFLINNRKYISNINILQVFYSLTLDWLKIVPIQLNFIILVCLNSLIKYLKTYLWIMDTLDYLNNTLPDFMLPYLGTLSTGLMHYVGIFIYSSDKYLLSFSIITNILLVFTPTFKLYLILDAFIKLSNLIVDRLKSNEKIFF